MPDETSQQPSNEEIQKMFGQALLTGLVALLLLTCSFIYFIGKQKSEMSDALVQLAPQSKEAQSIDTFFNNFIYDLTAYSQQHPEILQILVQSGFDVQQQQQQGGAKRDMPPLPAPPTQ